MTTPSTTVRVTDDGPVRIVTIDRPDRMNAVDLATEAELVRIWEAIEGDRDVRVVVRTEQDLLIVHIHDDGMGLTPRNDSPGLGLGLCLMAHETERFEIRKCAGGGTEVILHFKL